MSTERLLLAFDGTSWFLRAVRVTEHDRSLDEKVYRCDEHLGGPYTLDEAIEALSARAGQPRRAVDARVCDAWSACDYSERDAVLAALDDRRRRADDRRDTDLLLACDRARSLLAEIGEV